MSTPKPERTELTVRRATGGELRAALMLLPPAPGVRPDFHLVAGPRQPALVHGAASMIPLLTPRGESQGGVRLHVAPGLRQKGCGSLLLATLRAEAAKQGMRALTYQAAVQDDPSLGDFLRRRGFVPQAAHLTFEAETAALVGILAPLREQLRRTRGLGRGMTIVPLGEPWLEAAARLHSAAIGGTLPAVLAHLRERMGRRGPDDSALLLVDGQLGGMVLHQTVAGLTCIDARVVSPELRGGGAASGAANLELLGERLERAVQQGSQRCRFSCLSDNRQTLKLAARSHATLVAEERVLTLAL